MPLMMPPMMPRSTSSRPRRSPLLRVLLVTGITIFGALAWLLRPLPPVHEPAFRAADSYDDAQSRLYDLLSRDTLSLHAGCGTTAMLTGRRAPRAFVLLHGITNCPLQFAAIAESLRAGGDNVLVPRVDHHGLADRMTPDLAKLRAEELVALVTECVGIARGLGDTVVVCGLSTSGVAAAWAATNLAAVDRAVVIAPAFAPPWKPAWIAPLVTRLALRLPNRFVWWDDAKQQALPGPAQCYYGFSTRAMAQSYRLGEFVMGSLARRPPRAREVDVVTTGADHAVDNARIAAFAVRCRAGGTRVREYAFPAGEKVVHDMVDPVQVGERIEVTYPVLLAMLRGGTAPATN
jgi:pimeloyl-ACP methyl ester carboxylesterase